VVKIWRTCTSSDLLDLPTSLHFVGDTAFVVTQNGEVWKISNVR